MGIANKTVQDVFTPFTAVTTPEDSIIKCAQIMEANKLGLLLVMEGDNLMGVISERDITYKVVAGGKISADTKVEDIMTKTVYSVTKSESLVNAWNIMQERGFRHLVVQESVDDATISGVLSIRDLVFK